MLGIGGGVLLIPLLTGLFHVPIKTAIGASIVSVIATSSAAGTVYVGRGLAHTRLSMVLEIATTMGAISQKPLVVPAAEPTSELKEPQITPPPAKVESSDVTLASNLSDLVTGKIEAPEASSR